jgi:hypothetical protein
MKPDQLSTYTLTINHDQDFEILKVNPENDWKQLKLSDKWEKNQCGNFTNSTWKSNPKYKLEFLDDCELTITLTQQFKDGYNAIGLNIFDISKKSNDLIEINSKNLIYNSKEYYRSCYISLKFDKKKNEGIKKILKIGPFLIMPTAFEKQYEINFDLTFFTENINTIKVTKINNNDIKNLTSTEDEMKDLPKQIVTYPGNIYI